MTTKRQEIKSIQMATGGNHASLNESMMRPPRYHLCPNGVVVKYRAVSNLLIGELRTRIETELEAEKPEPPTEVISDGGPFDGEEIIHYDHPSYLVSLERWVSRVDALVNDRSAHMLMGRGILDVGFCSEDVIAKWGDLDDQVKGEDFQPFEGWEQEVEYYRAENSDLEELPESDIVVFVAYLCISNTAELQRFYSEIMRVRSVQEMIRDFPGRKKRKGSSATLGATTEKAE